VSESVRPRAGWAGGPAAEQNYLLWRGVEGEDQPAGPGAGTAGRQAAAAALGAMERVAVSLLMLMELHFARGKIVKLLTSSSRWVLRTQ